MTVCGEQLVDLLPERVGAPLSIANLRRDLEVDHKTVDRWLTTLENMYVCFRRPPIVSPRIRAVKKEKRLYLWDWSAVPDPAARFENLERAISPASGTPPERTPYTALLQGP